MAGEPVVTVYGNLTDDPDMKFLQDGKAVVNFTIASTPRRFDRQSNDWVDGDTLYMRCSAFGVYAENIAESLHKGNRVIALGTLKQRSWEDANGGGKRTVIEMAVEEVGPSLKFVTASIQRAERTNAQGQQQGGWGGQQQGQQQQGGWGQQQQGQPPQGQQGPPQGQQGPPGQQPAYGGQQQDPWATGQGQQQGWGAPDPSAPPF